MRGRGRDKAVEAIVLAAGEGKRLKPLTDKVPKPLIKVRGKCLLEINIEKLFEAGFKRIVVVANKKNKGKIKSFLRRKGFLGKVKLVINRGVNTGNAFSLYSARNHVKKEDFLFLVSDHLFEREILEKMRDSPCKLLTISLDQSLNEKKIKEGLKVLVANREIRNIGKEILEFNGVDAGIFKAKKEVFKHLEKSISRHGFKTRIEDFLKDLIREGNHGVSYCDITGHIWIDIDTFDDLYRANEIYKEILEKDSEEQEGKRKVEASAEVITGEVNQ